MNTKRNGHVSRHKDWEYRKNKNDAPPVVDVRESIMEVRRIYKEYTDREFAEWYAVRYGLRAAAVIAVLRGGGE